MKMIVNGKVINAEFSTIRSDQLSGGIRRVFCIDITFLS